MPKVKLTKGELKRQRDSLVRYKRYLPTLQLKKQQLQLEISRYLNLLSEKKDSASQKIEGIKAWAGLLAEPDVHIKQYLTPVRVITASKNIAGIDVPVFEGVDFPEAEYDLFAMPMWVDHAIDALCGLIFLEKEIKVIEDGIAILRHELRIATQRVNLFEKVKIPEALEAIRLIKIYIGDQMANAVGRSKIAKRKIEQAVFEEALA